MRASFPIAPGTLVAPDGRLWVAGDRHPDQAGGAGVNVHNPESLVVVDLFLSLFEVSGMESEIRHALSDAGVETHASGAGTDFRADVEAWLDHVTPSSKNRTR